MNPYQPRESHVRMNETPDGTTFTAVAADGTELGTYDVFMGAARLVWLHQDVTRS